MAAPIDDHFVTLQKALLGRYSLERELGRGGMGRVYLARDLDLDRAVALKVMHADLATQSGARERFLREARTAARLTHPHIVPVYSVQIVEPFVLMVMGLVDGESLGARIRRRGPLLPTDAERVLREIAWALSYAHARGVIHRDITLENILLERDSGRALLVDFGLAREVESSETGTVIGTPSYLAPEVIRGEGHGAPADLYALGAVGFAALTGKLPFEGDTLGALLAKHLVQPPPALAPLARGASGKLISSIEACLSKDPDARPQDAGAFHELLEREPARITIAPALRRWFTRWERIRPFYSLATPLVALQTYILMFGTYGDWRWWFGAASAEALLSLTVLPVLVQGLFEVRELRDLQHAGYGTADIRGATGYWNAEAIREHQRGQLKPLTNRVIFDLTACGVAVLVLNIFITFPMLGALERINSPLAWYLRVLFFLTPEFYIATMIGVGINFASPGYRLSPMGRVRGWIQRFWNSRQAERLARWAGAGAHARSMGSGTLHRSTELVLGLAVDDLWGVIPSELRTEMGDVPALAHTLQNGATELRGMIESLRESERDLSDDPVEIARLAEVRVPLEQRHHAAVKALEQIRLQLLRLLATQSRTAELDEHLSAARHVEREVLSDIAGHTAVRRALRHPTRRTMMPTPTPA